MNKKIRVLHTFTVMNRGGAETLIMNIYRKIDKSKFSFDFLCESSAKGDYDDEIKKLGGSIFYLKQEKNRPIKNIINIVKFLKTNGPYDVIHLPNMFYAGIFCLAAKIAGINKIVVHSHSASDTKIVTFKRKMYMTMMRFLINSFSTMRLSCGEEAAKYLFGTDKNVLILKNGVDISLFSKNVNNSYLKEEFNIKNEMVIACIARFVKVKNHEFFIKLGNYIKVNNLKVKILLVGDGELRNKIEDMITANGLGNIVICTGLRKDINLLLSIIDVIVMPSLYEGFPLSVVEALASSTPCVLSNTIDHNAAIIPEMVKFVDLNDDISIWYDVIANLAKVKINKNCVSSRLVSAGFDINTTTHLIEEIYKK